MNVLLSILIINDLKYNYYLNDVSDRVHAGAFDVHSILPILDHSCQGGRYILFGPWTKTRKNTGWELIKKLEDEGKISIWHKHILLYFVPAKTKRIKK